MSEGTTRSSRTGSDPYGGPGQSQRYSAYRPGYPEGLLDAVISGVRKRGLLNEGKESTLVDVATGTGRVVSTLAPHFKSAYGFDRSEAQLSAATPGPNITYQQAEACSIPLPDGSGSVITIGLGLHWLDIPRFCAECKRLLAPDGVVAVLSCTFLNMFASTPSIHSVFLPWFQTFKDCVESDLDSLEDEFAQTDFSPLVEVSRVREEVVRHMAVDEIMRYIGTWSPVEIWRRRNPTAPDPVEHFSTLLVDAAQKDGIPADGRIPVHFPFAAIQLASGGLQEL